MAFPRAAAGLLRFNLLPFLAAPCFAVLPLFTADAFAADAPPADTSVAAGPGTEITVYPGDLALVHDHRSFRLTAPQTRLAFAGVSERLQPETVSLMIVPSAQVKASEVKLLDQTFASHLISPQTLLEQSVGQEVSVISTNPATGRDTTDRAKIVSVQGGVVLDMGGKIYTGVPGRLVFDAVPGNLRAKPTLLVTAAGPVGKDISADLSYLTSGLGWHADYVAHYDSEGGRLDLTAWATVENTTGVEFKDAKLKLAAGDVNRVTPPMPVPMRTMAMRADASAAAVESPMAKGVSAQALDNINLYTIARPTTLSTGESKQLMLLQINNVPVKRDYIVRGQPWFYTTPMPGQTQTGAVEIEATLKNESARSEVKGAKDKDGKGKEPAAGNLGVALPAGVVRAYGEDDDGATQFLGEDRIDAVIPGGDMKLRFGHDSDMPVVREQTSFVRATDSITISAWRISIKNAKSKPVTVRVEEPIGGAWEITKEVIPHVKNDAGLPEWNLTIPPKGQAVLEYSVKTTM